MNILNQFFFIYNQINEIDTLEKEFREILCNSKMTIDFINAHE